MHIQPLLTISIALLAGSVSARTTSTFSAAGPGTTLLPGYYWVRAVSEPNFHKYVQSSPLLGEGPLVLESHTTAGQLQIVDGQLVQLVSEAGAAEDLLYAVVTTEKTHGGRTLAVSWSTTPNAYGAFAWQGDGLTWSTPEINRPNAMAWYVCEGQRMYVNLGPYLYQTPEGCADQTIHYYNDKTANE